jgi:hypothetical protein
MGGAAVLDPRADQALATELIRRRIGGLGNRSERLRQNLCGVRYLWSLAHACKSVSANMMLTQDELRLAIQVLGGPKAASRMLGCSDTLVRHWLTGRRLISAPKAWRLRELIISVKSELPGVAYNLKIAAQHAEVRVMQWRARRPRWQLATGDKPRLSPLERSERRWRDREIARRVAAGERITELAEEYGALPRTVERWARRGRN